MSERLDLIKSRIRDIPDFPKPGILFKDITPLLEDGKALAATVELMAERWADQRIERIAALESRGFPFGAALAMKLGVGMALLRKPGKLPHRTYGVDYALEYGTDRLELHVDAVHRDQRVLLVDDLLATGGTAGAAIRLLNEEAGAQVAGCAFVIELSFLGGAERLGGTPRQSLLTY